jgi:hypothetical protein
MLSKIIMFKSSFGRSFIVLAFLGMALSACGKKAKFDRRMWNDGDGLSFPERDAMLEDLLKNQKLKGLTYKQAIQLLHEPQRNSYTGKSFQYEIIRKMDGFDTVFAKTLTLYLNKDSVVTDFKVTEKDNTEKLKKVFKERNKKK